jgi:LysM repeat protein
MKTYTTKPNEDLGSIARKFGMPSWKYLYQINKDTIGDNPDLLKAGTVLNIPQWDSTSGDEKIKAKGADPFKYTGGLRYAYPWVPFSYTHHGEDGKPVVNFDPERKLQVSDRKTGSILVEKSIKTKDDLKFLIPDVRDINIGIEGMPFQIGAVRHIHPNDFKQTENAERKDMNTENTESEKDTLFKDLGFSSKDKPKTQL